MDLKKYVKEWSQKNGLQPNDEELEILTNDFKSRYEAAVKETNTSNNAPRTSTSGDSLQTARDADALQIESEGKAFDNYKQKGDYLLGARGTKLDQDTAAYVKRGDAHTDNMLALLGGTQRQMVNDGYASKERMMDKSVGYHSGYDDKLLGAINQAGERENQAMTLGFIQNLLGTAAMLAM